MIKNASKLPIYQREVFLLNLHASQQQKKPCLFFFHIRSPPIIVYEKVEKSLNRTYVWDLIYAGGGGCIIDV